MAETKPERRKIESEPLKEVSFRVSNSEYVIEGYFDTEKREFTPKDSVTILKHDPNFEGIGLDGKEVLDSMKGEWIIKEEKQPKDGRLWKLNLLINDEGEVDCKITKEGQWSIVMSSEEVPSYTAYDVVMSGARGFNHPINRYTEGVVFGRRPIVVEPNKDRSLGEVAPPIVIAGGEIFVLVQPDSNTTSDLKPAATKRILRASSGKVAVHSDEEANMTYADLISKPGKITLNKVDLAPDIIASSSDDDKDRVQLSVYQYPSLSDVPADDLDKGSLIPLGMYLDKYAEGPGLAAIFSYLVDKFGGKLQYNDEVAQRMEDMLSKELSLSAETNYGKAISIGLVIGEDNRWRVLVKEDDEGKFDRDGNPIPALVGRNFTPIQESALDYPLNLMDTYTHGFITTNNAREVGAADGSGIHPVLISICKDKVFNTMKSIGLQDVSEIGEGPVMMALGKFFGKLYEKDFKKWTSSNN